jgi:hypothetical protein
MMWSVKSLGSTPQVARQRMDPGQRDSGPADPVDRDRVPHAQLATVTGWRDPRLWVGVAILAGSVIVGAKVVSAADDTTSVWAVESNVAPGDPVTSDNLSVRRVRFVDTADQSRYLTATDEIPDGARMTRAVGAGELLPRSALGTAIETGVVELPITVDAGQVPPSVGAGSIVDLWVADTDASVDLDPKGDKAARLPQAALALEGVVVVEAPRMAEGFGVAGTRQLVIGVPVEQADELAGALGAAAAGRVVVTRQG